jgi:glycerophosphoryl diester phosphodiesterase
MRGTRAFSHARAASPPAAIASVWQASPVSSEAVAGRFPEVVAHRGANEDEPEHSLASYLQAVEDGADAVECDVRLTADGTLVCVHDRRIDRTSSGQGTVSALTLGELLRHDFSRPGLSWRDYESPAPDETRTNVLTLRTMIATLLDASPTIGFAIETKHPTRFGGYVEEELVDTLEYFGLARRGGNGGQPGESRVRLMSFSARALRRIHRSAPGMPTVLLMEAVPRRLRDGSLPENIGIAGVSIAWVRANPEYVGLVREKGNAVHVWTVDSPADVTFLAALGVDAIISNRPLMVRAALEKARASG